jgi:hypothetical protein
MPSVQKLSGDLKKYHQSLVDAKQDFNVSRHGIPWFMEKGQFTGYHHRK